MPMFIAPVYEPARIREANDCHEPGGRPTGGRFCSKNGAGASLSSITEQRAKADELRHRWAELNNQCLPYMSDPHHPALAPLLAEMKEVVKERFKLRADPGGLAGVGYPGGPRDILIIGAGPGGLAAAVMAGADGMDTLFIDAEDKPGGAAKYSSRVENLLGHPLGSTGAHLAAEWYEQAQRMGAEGMLGVRVTGITHDPATDLKTVTLSNGKTIESRTVIIAGGVKLGQDLSFEGADAKGILGADPEVLQRAGRGKDVVIVGGANSAMQASLALTLGARSVTVLSRSSLDKGASDYQVQQVRGNPRITVIEGQGDEIARVIKDANGNATHIVTTKGKTIPAQVIGLFTGGRAQTSWLPPSIALEQGKIKAPAETMETTMPGVFAVGDIRAGAFTRIGVAMGEGQIAAANAWSFIHKNP